MNFKNTQLSELAKEIEKQMAMEKEVEELRAQLKDKEDQLRELSEKTIPTIMDEIGLSSFSLNSGTKIETYCFFRGTFNEENAENALDWLRETGNEGIVKYQFSINASDKEVLEKVRDISKTDSVSLQIKPTIHPSTLSAFIREQVSSGADFPQELFKTYIGRKTRISK
jgi:hypothetical protein